MAYNKEKLTKLKALEAFAERIRADYATKKSVEDLKYRVNTLEAGGGESNVITSVKVNGTAQEIVDKAVNISVPTKVSDLDNDSGFQTAAEVAAAVAASSHLTRKKVNSVEDIDPAAADAQQYIYMVPKTGGENGSKYKEYLVLDGAVVPVGDWSVDLSGYQEKEAGKGLSSNDYTNADKTKLTGIAEGATKVEATAGSGTLSINGTAIELISVATDEEVSEMLNTVFGAIA